MRASSAEWADSIWGSSEPDGEPSASPRSTPTPRASSQSVGPAFLTSGTSSPSLRVGPQKIEDGGPGDTVPIVMAFHANQSGTDAPPSEVAPQSLAMRGREGGNMPELADVMPSIRTPGGGSSYPMALTGSTPPSGQAASPARISASPASGGDSPVPDPDWPTASSPLWSDTDLPPSSSRTYLAFSPVMPVGTLGRSSVLWGNSGTGGPTGFSTLNTSECPSVGGACSSSPSTLASILEESVPQRYFLSARAAEGILRRATKRGRELPPALETALRALASTSPTPSVSATPLDDSTPTVRRLSPLAVPPENAAPTRVDVSLRRGGLSEPGQPVAWTASEQANSFAWETPDELYPTLNAQAPNDSSNLQQGVRQGSSVRRLTPLECERLMNWPPGWTISHSWKGRK